MNIISRIRRIEAAMIQPARGAVILREPAAIASDEARQTFEQELSGAQTAGHTVIVHRNGTPRASQPGVTYVDNDVDALLHLLAFSHSDSHQNALAELLANIQGHTLQVVQGGGNA